MSCNHCDGDVAGTDHNPNCPEARFDAAYLQYLQSLDSCQAFVYHQRSHASRTSLRGNGWLKQLDSRTADLLVLMGKMASARRELLDVALAVVRTCNPHASRAEWCARLFESARGVLLANYDDVERRSGPEVGRLRDYVREYTRAEKLIVLETLSSVCDDSYGKLGWAAERCANELDVRNVIRTLTGK